jgi:hypothetical protein
VFVTDAIRVEENRWAVGVQAPLAHSYYNDHRQEPALLDPLLLLEACRQAVTVPAHRDLGVPFGTAFLISGWRTALTDVSALRSRDDGPDELVLLVAARDLKQRGGRPLGATFDVEYTVAGRTVGTSEVVAGYLSGAAYQAYRESRRGSVPPMSGAMPPRGGGALVEPEAVGRRDGRNVVLADLVRADEHRSTAELDVPVAHPAMFDHALDHIPAMALLEAARQAAVLAAGPATAAPARYATGFAAAFHHFAELDTPTTVSAVAGEPRTVAARDGLVRTPVAVEFAQKEALVCTVAVDVAEPGR